MNAKQNTSNSNYRSSAARWSKVAAAVAVSAFAAVGAAAAPVMASYPVDDPAANTVSTTYEPATYPCFNQPTPDRWGADAGSMPRCARSFSVVNVG